jgi:hypothetical protein
MNGRLEALRLHLTEAVKSGSDTGALRSEIRQFERDGAQSAAELHRLNDGEMATAVMQITARATELVSVIVAVAATKVQPIEQTMTYEIPANLKTLIEHGAHRVASAEADQAKADADYAAKKIAAHQIANRIAENARRIEDLRSVSQTRSLTESESATLNLAILDKEDLAQLAAIANAAVQEAALVARAAKDKVRDARVTLSTFEAQAEFELSMAQARDLETALVASLDKMWSAAKSLQPNARWVAVWQPGAALKRATTHGQPPLGGIA